MKVFVYGAGRCGGTLARALTAAGHEVATWTRSDGGEPNGLADADVVWITVPDDAIAEVARVVGPHQVALHASGVLPAEALRTDANPRAVAAVHPLQSFTSESLATHVRGIWFGIQGEAEATQIGAQLVEDMGARSFLVADEDAKALYHAACCVASNAMVALADQAVTLFAAAGVPRADALAALTPLISGTAANLARASEARDVLTGPIARGDEATVKRHKAAIARRVPEASADYTAACAAIRKLID